MYQRSPVPGPSSVSGALCARMQQQELPATTAAASWLRTLITNWRTHGLLHTAMREHHRMPVAANTASPIYP